MKKVILVTGDSSGIGKDICDILSIDNVVYGLSRKSLETSHNHLVCDVLDEEKIKTIVDEIYAKHNRLDLVICVAGMGVSGATELIDSKNRDAQIDINLKGVINVDKAVIPYMRKQGFGRIVHVSSVAAIAPIPFQSFYSASKAALNNYSLALNNELKPFNIKVITVMPGDTSTGFTSARKKVDDNENIYQGRVQKSVSRMEKDETNGAPSIKVAKAIIKYSNKRNPKVLYTIGFIYKFLGFLIKILPTNLVNKILYLMYGK